MSINKLVIVESPSKAKTIGKYLGNDYKVVSSYGHVRTIPSVSNAVNIQDGFTIEYDIISRTSKHIKEIVSLSKESNEIYLATDPDREGEAISWHIVELLKQKRISLQNKTIHRIVFHEITPKIIKKAIAEPRQINMDLVHAQRSRQILDYLVGFTISPILWRKLPGSRSAGRVQSVALKMIYERETEIEAFKIEEYWKIEGHFSLSDVNKSSFYAYLHSINNKKLNKLHFKNKEQVESTMNQIESYSYRVGQVEKKLVKKSPAAPFTTSTLLQEASRKLGFSSKRTSQIAQKLYEGISINSTPVGLITYMRTDSTYISSDVAKSTNSMVGKLYGDKYRNPTVRIYRKKSKNAQEAHEAIRPTNIEITPDSIRDNLTEEQYRLYDLIWKRMVASQMSDVVLQRTTIDVDGFSDHDNSTVSFRCTGSVIEFEGFYRLYKSDADEVLFSDNHNTGKKDNIMKIAEQILPDCKENDDLSLISLDNSQHFTQPPSRYNEASLIKKMEELGIGRPSTYHSIISILQERNYVELRSKRFFISERGRLVVVFLERFFTEYVEYNFTSNMENDLDRIAQGQLFHVDALEEFWQKFNKKSDLVKDLDTSIILSGIEEELFSYLYGIDYKSAVADNKIESIKLCNSCKTGTLQIKNSKYGPFIGCSNYPDCTFTRTLHEETDGDVESSQSIWPKLLGQDHDGIDVFLNKGPYGFYVMRHNKQQDTDIINTDKGKNDDTTTTTKKRRRKTKKDNVKMISLPKGVSHNDVDLAYATKLLQLPITIGQHPEDSKDIAVAIGIYGPYVKHGSTYASVKRDDFMDIGYDEALALIEAKKKKGSGNYRRKTTKSRINSKNKRKTARK